MRVFEIFDSVDGEVNRWGQGMPTTFVRLAGCNLRCPYCDTGRAQPLDSGNDMSVRAVVDRVLLGGLAKVTITGGEPMLQLAEVVVLTRSLIAKGILVSIETNGSLDLTTFMQRLGHIDRESLCLVVDYKVWAPDLMHQGAFAPLGSGDWVKCVVGSRREYEVGIDCLRSLYGERFGSRLLSGLPRLAFSPVAGMLAPATLGEWIRRDGLAGAGLNVQLHKYIGVP